MLMAAEEEASLGKPVCSHYTPDTDNGTLGLLNLMTTVTDDLEKKPLLTRPPIGIHQVALTKSSYFSFFDTPWSTGFISLQEKMQRLHVQPSTQHPQ